MNMLMKKEGGLMNMLVKEEDMLKMLIEHVFEQRKGRGYEHVD